LNVRDEILDHGRRSKKQAAELTGVNYTTLANWLNGDTSAGPEVIRKISLFLRVKEEDVPKKLDRRGGSIERFVMTPEQLNEARKGNAPSVRGDFEAALKWVAAGWDESTFKQTINRAVDAGRSDVARVLLDLLDARRPSAAAGNWRGPSSAQDVADARCRTGMQNPVGRRWICPYG
jgi:transcriptional regulator with XRE-family HTH domain